MDEQLEALGRLDLLALEMAVDAVEREAELALGIGFHDAADRMVRRARHLVTGRQQGRDAFHPGVPGKVEPAAKDTVRQTVSLQQGIPIEKAREIVKFIKDTKLRVQASINGDFVRVAGKDRDTLQKVIALLKEKDFGIDTQFTNYRSN